MCTKKSLYVCGGDWSWNNKMNPWKIVYIWSERHSVTDHRSRSAIFLKNFFAPSSEGYLKKKKKKPDFDWKVQLYYPNILSLSRWCRIDFYTDDETFLPPLRYADWDLKKKTVPVRSSVTFEFVGATPLKPLNGFCSKFVGLLVTVRS